MEMKIVRKYQSEKSARVIFYIKPDLKLLNSKIVSSRLNFSKLLFQEHSSFVINQELVQAKMKLQQKFKIKSVEAI